GDPNLFASTPGDTPTFVATLAVNDPLVVHAAEDVSLRSTEDFEVTPDGSFAAFASRRPITGYATNGHFEVYRYDRSGGLDCASCAPTGARAESDATLPRGGLGLSDDGRVFFTTGEALVLRDLNDRKTDAYQWGGNAPNLISTGTSEFDSAL